MRLKRLQADRDGGGGGRSVEAVLVSVRWSLRGLAFAAREGSARFWIGHTLCLTWSRWVMWGTNNQCNARHCIFLGH